MKKKTDKTLYRFEAEQKKNTNIVDFFVVVVFFSFLFSLFLLSINYFDFPFLFPLLGDFFFVLILYFQSFFYNNIISFTFDSKQTFFPLINYVFYFQLYVRKLFSLFLHHINF